jgi:hypothetical protein
MYCPSCGAELTLELNYCSRCGANVAASMAPVRELAPISLTAPTLAIGLTVVLITLGGFVLLITGAVKLAEVFHVPDPIMAILVLGMATIAICDFLLLRLLSRIINASLEAKKETTQKLPRPQNRETPKQLTPRLEPVPSVTEHTTRTFSPVFIEPSDRGTK